MIKEVDKEEKLNEDVYVDLKTTVAKHCTKFTPATTLRAILSGVMDAYEEKTISKSYVNGLIKSIPTLQKDLVKLIK